MRPKVSILIPTRDRVDLLRPCIESIETLSTYKEREIIVVDNGSQDPATVEYLKGLGHRVLRSDDPFNFARINNLAVKKASGEFVVLLNNDTIVITPDWLEAMIEHAQRPEVGQVGVKLVDLDGTLQHAGIAFLPEPPKRFVQVHEWLRKAGQDPFTDVVRNFSAVTAACMMMRRELYLEMDGLDERFTVAFNDVDLCLRLRQKGYWIVYTPHAVLYHHESASRGHGRTPNADEDALHRKWLQTLDGDPFFGATGTYHGHHRSPQVQVDR